MPLPDQLQLTPGTVLGHYRIVRRLGGGGMGDVYLADHIHIKTRRAALKIPRLVSDTSLERFIREAEAAAQINHPNVVTIYDFGVERGLHYLAMRYVEGTDLARLVAQQGQPLIVKQALKIIALAARGTAAVHQQKLIHRDIKPANIMIAPGSKPSEQQVILMDFGLVRDLDGSEITIPGHSLGTPAYMSPEQARGEDLDSRSDLFSLGSTLYFLLTAQHPYDSPTQNAREVLHKVASGQRPRPVREINSFVSREVSDFVQQVMAPRREDRIPTATHLERELTQLLKGISATPSLTPETMGSASQQTAPQISLLPDLDLVELEPTDETLVEKVKHHWPWVAGGTALGLVTLVAILIMILTRPGSTNTPTTPAAPPVVGGPKPPATTPSTADRFAGMVKVPAGRARIGCDVSTATRHALGLPKLRLENDRETFIGMATQYPDSTVQVPAFWIDKYEVTNAAYLKFVKATQRPAPAHWIGGTPPVGQENWPVTQVSHADALAYAAWAGKRVCSHAQWIRAFRGDTENFYPWGNTWENGRANVEENPTLGRLGPVTSSPDDVSSYGVCNLVGLVREVMRETWFLNGQDMVVTRGGDYGSTGCAFGAATATFVLSPSLVADPVISFRCVIEEP